MLTQQLKHMKIPHLLAGAAMVLALQSCQSEQKKENSNLETNKSDSLADSLAKTKASSPDALLTDDVKTFILPAAIGGMMEVEAGNLVLQKSGNPEVKAFAAQMVKDHTQANKELEPIAKAKGVTIPTMLPEAQGKHLVQMQTLSGRSLDVHYITMMIKDHASTVALFEQASRYNDPAVTAFVTKTLPVIKGHYQTALKLGKSLNITNVNNGDDFPNVRPDTMAKK
jgi:putative membrane protein